MTVAGALTALNQDIINARAAITAKGGIVASGGGSSQLATDITTIPDKTKFGLSIDNFLGNLDENGVLQAPTTINGLTFTGLKTLNGHFVYKFAGNEAIHGEINFIDLETIAANSLQNTFKEMPYVTSVRFPKLKTISVAYAFQNTFYTTPIKNIYFDKLDTITKTGCFSSCFGLNQYLENIYFNSLTTSSFNGFTNTFAGMFGITAGMKNGCTVHFPSNLQSLIQTFDGYPTFGGKSNYITIAFDLPTTS